jgi:hypothetical protein
MLKLPNRQTSGESASLPQYLGCNTVFDMRLRVTFLSNNNIFSFVAMSADSVPSSKTNIFQNKLIYCRHFRTYSRCAMFDWSDTNNNNKCTWGANFIMRSLPLQKLELSRFDLRSHAFPIGKPRVSPLRFLNTSAVTRYLIHSNFSKGRILIMKLAVHVHLLLLLLKVLLYLTYSAIWCDVRWSNQTLRTANKF